MRKCPVGWSLFNQWNQAAADALDLYTRAGLTGKELIEAQQENANYKNTLAVYRAHLKKCPECKTVLEQVRA